MSETSGKFFVDVMNAAAKRQASMMSVDSETPLPWRAGRKVGRTIYDANDVLIGVMDTPALAARVVAAVNGAR